MVVVRAKIVNEAYQILSTGHAEEFRSTSQVNRTDAMENAETSAIGRALANLGYLGSDIASEEDIRKFFAEDMRLNPDTEEGVIMDGEEVAMLKQLPEETKALVRQYILRGYIAGWTRCELEILEIKARART